MQVHNILNINIKLSMSPPPLGKQDNTNLYRNLINTLLFIVALLVCAFSACIIGYTQ